MCCVGRLMSAAIPAAIVFFFLWYIPDGGKWDMHYKFIYYFILYLCFQALLTVRILHTAFVQIFEVRNFHKLIIFHSLFSKIAHFSLRLPAI